MDRLGKKGELVRISLGNGIFVLCYICPADPYKTDPGACGCGVADNDSDGDGVP